MSFEDPFEDFRRKQSAQPKPEGEPVKSAQERLEKISDYFPAVKPGAAPGPAGAATQGTPIPNLQIVALCNVLRARGILTPDDVRRVLDGKA